MFRPFPSQPRLTPDGENTVPKNNIMTVKTLRDSLAQLGSAYDDKPVLVWMPGTYIALETTISFPYGQPMIEGNVVAYTAPDAAAFGEARTLAHRTAEQKANGFVPGQGTVGALGAENIGSSFSGGRSTVGEIDK